LEEINMKLRFCDVGTHALTRASAILLLMLLWVGTAHAQFSGSIKGVVQDPSGAAVPSAKVELLNTATSVSSTTATDSTGNYEFPSLAPGTYQITVEATGFVKDVVTVTLETNQTLNVPIGLTLKAVTQTVEVTGAPPVLNTAETRNQMTLENQGVAQLPIAGRQMVTLATFAPGVTGLGSVGSGVPGAAGTPGSGPDNYSTETQVDASANGMGQMSNMWVVDGLDVTSGIRQGVLNLTPNPDSVQETSIQVNTFTAEYGRSDGLQVTMTTKSGSDHFHGFATDYFEDQHMFTREEFTTGKYAPFHSNNMSFGVGGPVIPHHQFFFFADIEPLRSSQAVTSGGQTFADPAFIDWAQTNFPDTIGTGLLATYQPAHLSGVTVSRTAERYLLGAAGCATGQTTIPITATVSIPCTLNMIDSGSLGTTAIRNGTQWFVRVDKYFSRDRIYGSFYRTTLTYGEPTAVPAFSPANNQNWQRAYQFNWTHTFSPNTLNEAIFGGNRVEGTLGSGAPDYTVPNISVTGITADGGMAFGVGFAQGDFIQHNYHWRDVLTHIRGKHTLKFGYEGWFGDDVEPFQGPYSTPTFSFTDLTTLVQDAPRSEAGAMYDPTTGLPVLWSWNAASSTWGLFAQDVWKVKPNLSLTLGLRWDDQGNPYSRSATTVFGNYYLGPSTSSTLPSSFSTFQTSVANGFAKATHHALNHAVDNLLSPTIGVAWDPTGHGVWAVRGGFGVYSNWLTQANVQEEFRGNPPGPVIPTFFARGTATAGPPVFALGSSNKPPFGFTYATFSAGLNNVGGITGLDFPIGGINPNLQSPRADIWAVTVDRKIGRRLVAHAGYSGSHSYNLVGNNDQQGIVSYGVDINAFPGDLIQHESLVPTRLNTSFGAITYSDNNRYGNYQAVDFGVRGQFRRGFFNASYTRSSSKDDAGNYPNDGINPGLYYSPSPWDAPNRFSLTLNYSLRGLREGKGLIGHLTGGWGVSGTSLFQSGYPFTVVNTNPFFPVCQNGTTNCPSVGNPITGFAANSGDYNADGDALDYPDATSYVQGTSRHAFLTGIFADPLTQFTAPGLGTQGNEKHNAFRNPNFAETDAAFYKDNRIKENVNLQFRIEFFNIFNRANLGFVDANPPDVNFGRSTTQQLPRWFDVALKLTF
jgi:hypothetical protein